MTDSNNLFNDLQGIFQNDQKKAAWLNMATTMWAYYSALTGLGFAPGEALQLVINFQQVSLELVRRTGDADA